MIIAMNAFDGIEYVFTMCTCQVLEYDLCTLFYSCRDTESAEIYINFFSDCLEDMASFDYQILHLGHFN